MTSYSVSVPSGNRTLTAKVGNLPADEYEVRLVTVASAEGSRAMSNPSPSATFHVRANDTTSKPKPKPDTTSIPDHDTELVAGSGSVGGVLILTVVVLVGTFFLSGEELNKLAG